MNRGIFNYPAPARLPPPPSPVNRRIEISCACRFYGDKKESEDDWDGPDSITLSDPDVLNCPICVHPLTIPVYQCTNGHVICSSCCSNISSKKCPSCSSPTLGTLKNRAIEKVIESARVACRYRKYGCKEMVQYSSMEEHFTLCRFSPRVACGLECPLPHCSFSGSYLNWHSHIIQGHRTDHIWLNKYGTSFSFDTCFDLNLEKAQKCIILQCLDHEEEHDLFVLNNFKCAHGNAITLSRAAPASCVSPCFDIMAARRGSFSESVSLHSSADCIQEKVNSLPAKKTLFVPDNFEPLGKLHLKVRISKTRSPFCGNRHPE